ncbi:hypothetical protein SLEP1_g56810 [Rubroshorea leprosula]|uniref:Secreted protein n=1 Tax=Rubroshorea leprosula TaxID=152421 RepID=A0AAV5MM58_9ROSI|nr:hypothetical protein SLEP1_g56810 [Rubroshorea leprosula]
MYWKRRRFPIWFIFSGPVLAGPIGFWLVAIDPPALFLCRSVHFGAKSITSKPPRASILSFLYCLHCLHSITVPIDKGN